VDAGGLDRINKAISQLEKDRARQERQRRTTPYEQFRMGATNPPSTSVTISGGWGGFIGLGGYWHRPTTALDLADYSVTRRRNTAFANPYWYGFYWMAISMTDLTRVYIGGGADFMAGAGDSQRWFPQYETAVEAEQGAQEGYWQLHTYPPWDYGPMLGCVILRNNGNTTEANQFMPIDPVNRGRSYIWWTHDKFVPVGPG
jgi:hypothetical protein